jgi:hypothetical protein
MAHHIQIPLAFEFRPLRASWELVAAEITGETCTKSPSADLCFSAKVNKGSAPYLCEIPWQAMPEEVLRLYSEKSSVLPDLRGYSAELLACLPIRMSSDKRPEADPWTMRNEFLQLKRNNKSLLAFLKKWGVWGTTPTVYGRPEPVGVPHTGGLRRRDLGLPPLEIKLDPELLTNIFASSASDLDRPAYVLPASIWSFHQQCRKALTSPADKWLTDFQKYLLSTIRPRYPYFFLGTGKCQEAIIWTITIDLLKKVQFRLCARRDCRTPFAIENQHRREYCCQYCAHIESVRRQRRLGKLGAKPLSKGATHAKRKGAR